MNHLQDDMLSEARGYFINGNYKMAEPILNQMLLQNTRNPEVYQMLATIFYDKGQFSKAIKTFKRALEIDPTYTDASVGLSIILNDLGKYDEGKQVFFDAQAQLEKKSGKQDPFVDEKLASKHEELADLYFQYKRYNEALEQLLKAQKLSSRKSEITLRVAEVYVQLGQPERAIKDLKALIREFPHLIPARLKLGAIYYNSNNIAEATEQWENILIRDPHHPEALRYLKMAQAAGITSIDL
ncbi:tetratricopeptide repeat protein [Bdellovibrio sp. HCB2-146]|uniref:tetratricopeptide repeat protein n=1 Tax=Bdellovibrio sp. HCB2-146 TaxID=3394362 RepID=UPI0039BD6A1F